MSGKGCSLCVLRESTLRHHLSLLDDAWDSGASCVLLPDKTAASDEWLADSIASIPEDLATGCFALLTSGSTGLPKIVIGTKSRAERLAGVIHDLQELEAVRQTITCLPITYSYAFVNQWVWSKTKGRPLIQTDGLARPEDLREALENARDAMICMVGAQVPVLSSFFSGQQFEGITCLNFAGGRFPQDHMPTLHTLFPNARVFNNYGCAEALPRLSIRPELGDASPANIGVPLPGVEFSSGNGDELLFRSRYRAIAIVEDKTFRRIEDADWIATGDVGQQQADGSWLLQGRRSEVFKRYGEKISLSSIHDVVERVWPGGIGFYREVDKHGEDGYAMVISPRPPADNVKLILSELRKRCSRPHWPLRLEGVDALPLLPSNKIDGVKLKEMKDKVFLWTQRQ